MRLLHFLRLFMLVAFAVPQVGAAFPFFHSSPHPKPHKVMRHKAQKHV